MENQALTLKDINKNTIQNIPSRKESGRLTKEELKSLFEQIFGLQNNSNCIQCGRKSKHWVQMKHCIFLCMTCACKFKELNQFVDVRNIDQQCQKKHLRKHQMARLKRHGNKQFHQFMKSYDLHHQGYQIKIKSKASAYYRQMIQLELKQRLIQPKPQVEVGQQIYVPKNQNFLKDTVSSIKHIGSNIKKNASSISGLLSSKASLFFRGKSKKNIRQSVQEEKYQQTFKIGEGTVTVAQKRQFYTLPIESEQHFDQDNTPRQNKTMH